MCIVIDMNTLPKVFNEKDKNHKEFSPVKEWIEKRWGVIVFGGSKYKKELSKSQRYLKIIRLYKESHMAVSISDDVVDKIEREVVRKTKDTDCDDQHIIALLGASRCYLLCSVDERSFPYITNTQLYPRNMSGRPRIYSSSRNTDLLRKTDSSQLLNVE